MAGQAPVGHAPLQRYEYIAPASSKLKLHARLFLLQGTVLLLLTVLLGTLLAFEMRRATEHEFGQRALIASRTVALMPVVVKALESDRFQPGLNRITEAVRRRIGADYIVVVDRHDRRWTHPNPAKIGQPMSAVVGQLRPEDAWPLHGHETVTVATGSLGPAIRARSPVYNQMGQTVGFVSTGFLLPTIQSFTARATRAAWPWLAVGLLLALLCSLWVSYALRRELLQLEPSQISALVEQHRSVLDALQEGVLVVDAGGRVQSANPLALYYLGVEVLPLQLTLSQLWPELLRRQLLAKVPQSGISVSLRQRPMMVSTAPCGSGWVITLRDQAEVTRMAQELTYSRELTDLLRAQSHEFMNQLHTVAGLTYLGRPQEVLKYIDLQAATMHDLQDLLTRIQAPCVAALVIGKLARAQERQVNLKLEPALALSQRWEPIAATVLVPVLGNLLENAFDAATEAQPPGEAQVTLLLAEDPEGLELEVADNGPGVPQELLDLSGERFSTHGPTRGYGLPLVLRLISGVKGTLTVVRENDQTRFRVVIPYHNS